MISVCGTPLDGTQTDTTSTPQRPASVEEAHATLVTSTSCHHGNMAFAHSDTRTVECSAPKKELSAVTTGGATSRLRALTVVEAIDTSAGSGQPRNQSMVHPDTMPGNFRARSANVADTGDMHKTTCKYLRTRWKKKACRFDGDSTKSGTCKRGCKGDYYGHRRKRYEESHVMTRGLPA
jgi:hypothetical protein